jgi:Na+/H+ antiporter NhaA
MGELLRNWMPFPRRAPLGMLGLAFVSVFLMLADFDKSANVAAFMLLGFLCIAGMALSVLSLARERTKLFGYIGLLGAFLYLIASLTSAVLAAAGALS